MQASIEQWVFRFAGLMVLASALLAHFVHPNWIWLAAFVGANLFQASFTGFCPLAKVLARLGIKPGAAFGKA